MFMSIMNVRTWSMVPAEFSLIEYPSMMYLVLVTCQTSQRRDQAVLNERKPAVYITIYLITVCCSDSASN